MSIWLQNSTLIQKRTSPLKFDHFRYQKSDFSASDLSTKAPGAKTADAIWGPRSPRGREPRARRDADARRAIKKTIPDNGVRKKLQKSLI